jgi:hypothetical protein
MDALTKFLFRLSSDPRKLRQFHKDPLAAMRRAGLTRREKVAVLSKSADKIRNALRLRLFGPGEVL